MGNPQGPDPYAQKADGKVVSWQEASEGSGGAASWDPIHLNPGPGLLAFSASPLQDEGWLAFARKDDDENFRVVLKGKAVLRRLVWDPGGGVYLLARQEDGAVGLLARLR